jgi:hypothetical protein
VSGAGLYRYHVVLVPQIEAKLYVVAWNVLWYLMRLSHRVLLSLQLLNILSTQA